ncbi:FecCD family ABC transporter permease [Marinomonas aquiplantarum]|uniref:Iron complex transport system permease protein n=1 Tax=Marinomonas aquiplantarum TaxID=491951 RepID=A0A366CUT8_9GAMM|nr:iron ABC transporter permease [Marinomonas aquiplantarum]RBO80080.1 iron complex transport system permease protein [Marinomonas aquiplantarum]
MRFSVIKRSPYLCLIIAACLVSLLALTQGAYAIAWNALFTSESHTIDRQILTTVRLPRLLMAMLVGAALAISGAMMQALFRNPLADPGLLGVSSGASVFVGILIVLNPVLHTIDLPLWAQSYLQSVAAFLGAVLTCWLIFQLSKHKGKVSVLHLLLAGIAINALSGSATGLLTYLSNDEQLRALTFWAMGSIGGARWEQVIVMASLVLPIIYIVCRQSGHLNLLLLGEEEARYLGLNVEKFKRKLVVFVAICVGVSVAFTGLIGFIGLMVPHLIRMLFGADNRLVLPCSALLGASLLAGADTLARTIVIPAELPVGLVTSLLGGPFFLWLLLRNIRESH